MLPETDIVLVAASLAFLSNCSYKAAASSLDLVPRAPRASSIAFSKGTLTSSGLTPAAAHSGVLRRIVIPLTVCSQAESALTSPYPEVMTSSCA